MYYPTQDSIHFDHHNLGLCTAYAKQYSLTNARYKYILEICFSIVHRILE